ncbi:shikimate dehydrogenase [Aeromicrobium sp. IC_218]|nr:shikimate dehydrogenase [Aeromicrobium sp. IC_218]
MLMTARCAVLGSPVAHSLSPVMHRRAYADLGLDWTYESHDVDEAALPGFLAGLDESWRGLSCTMPLKQAALDLADEVDPFARVVGVANTLVRTERGGWRAHNTDTTGAVAALDEQGVGTVSSARVLGGGATARSLLHGLLVRGLEHVELVVRDKARVASLAEQVRGERIEVVVREFDAPFLDKVDLLVSTVPSDVVRHDAHDLVDASRAVFDVLYDPWPTALAATATVHGVPLVTGLDLLAHQAAGQVELMTGSTVPAARLREAAVAELEAR